MYVRSLTTVCLLALTLLSGSAAAADLAEPKKACPIEEGTVARKALVDAKAALDLAIDVMKAPTPADLNRLQKWFGVVASDTASKVQKIYKAALTTFTKFGVR